MGAIDIQTGNMLEGDLPNRTLRLVQEWIELHRNELLEIWKSQQFLAIPPLD